MNLAEIQPVLAFIGGLGMTEMVIIGIIAVLLFGQKLPEVARSLGKSYNDFRRGLHDMQSQIDFRGDIDNAARRSSYSSRSTYDDYDDYEEPTAPKFEPPPAEPQAASSPVGESSDEATKE